MKSFPKWIPKQWVNNPPQNILFRTDAGTEQGLSYGHLFRCIVIAEFARKFWNTHITFLTCSDSRALEYIEQYEFNIKQIDNSHNEISTVVDLTPFDWVVIDIPYPSYPLSTQCSQLAQSGKRIFLIDDVKIFTPSNISVYHNSGVLANSLICRHDSQIEYQIGPDYFIGNLPPPKVTRSTGQPPKNILVTFGGSDPSGLTLMVSIALKEYFSNFPGLFTIITGPGYNEYDKLVPQVESTPNQQLVDNPNNLYSHMLRSDLVICAGGRTLYEVYKLNLEVFAIASIEHEARVIEHFAEQGILKYFQLKWNENEFRKIFTLAIG